MLQSNSLMGCVLALTALLGGNSSSEEDFIRLLRERTAMTNSDLPNLRAGKGVSEDPFRTSEG
jgi:hypothetical protein